MLHLHKKYAYQYSQIELNHFKNLKLKYGRRFQHKIAADKKAAWYDTKKATSIIKNKLLKHKLLHTRYSCSYCHQKLYRSTIQIDHFIPCAEYPKYSFHPLNLIVSCDYCNATLKNQFDPILTNALKYSKIEFSIVHPLLDNVQDEIRYNDTDRLTVDMSNSSTKGIKTIRLFRLANIESIFQRTNQFTQELFYPLTDKVLQELVDECITYLPKKRK
jgi:uncharacterized protein (TIGR02646 family)